MVICWQWGHCFCSARYSCTTTRSAGLSTRLSPLSSTCCHRVQVVLAALTRFYWQLGDLIWRGRELQARSQVSWLPARLLLARIARKLFGLHTKRSAEGGRWLLWLSDACWSRNAFIGSLKLLICSSWCWITAFCSASNACCCWIRSSRCASRSRSILCSSRSQTSSSSIVMPVLYWV
jgi:hypothetical protein